MENATTFKNDHYLPLLKERGIQYKESERWLEIGRPILENKWVLFVSSRTLQATELLNKVVPFLVEQDLSFKIIKNQVLINKTNSWGFGIGEVGKVITIYTPSEKKAVELAEELIVLTAGFSGPEIPGCLKIGEVVYCCFSQLISQATNDKDQKVHGIKMYIPDPRNNPFPSHKRYLKKEKKRLVGKYYVLVRELKDRPKGTFYKAINTKKLSFTWCFIKKSNINAVDDFENRDMRHRLQWQKTVMLNLQDTDATPRYLDYFEKADHSYLVMEYVEGESFTKVIRSIFENKILWCDLPGDVKYTILSHYLKGLLNVDKVHESGYVHRDLSPNNFMLTADGKVVIIDFELAFSITKSTPEPPFFMGTQGFIAPEQLKRNPPTFKEDIYSLGALLAFMITGEHPDEVINQDRNLTRARLIQMTGNPALVKVILECVDNDPANRPSLKEVQKMVSGQLVYQEKPSMNDFTSAIISQTL